MINWLGDLLKRFEKDPDDPWGPKPPGYDVTLNRLSPAPSIPDLIKPLVSSRNQTQRSELDYTTLEEDDPRVPFDRSGFRLSADWRESERRYQDYLKRRNTVQPSPDRNRRAVNPAFAVVRGGAFGSNAQPGTPPARGLANFIKAAGGAEPVSSQYERLPVHFGKGPGQWEGYGYYPRRDLRGGQMPGGIILSNLLNSPDSSDADTLQPAYHEAIHAYDWQQKGISSTKEFKEAVAQSLQQYPIESSYITNTVPNLGDMAHIFTAAIDLGLTMAEIPLPLRRFYEGILPAGRLSSLLRRRGRKILSVPNGATE